MAVNDKWRSSLKVYHGFASFYPGTQILPFNELFDTLKLKKEKESGYSFWLSLERNEGRSFDIDINVCEASAQYCILRYL